MIERTHKQTLGVLSLFLIACLSPAQHLASLSPAQQKIIAAQSAIAAKPGEFQLHNDLAAALIRRARETSDPAYYDQAETALNQSFRLSPGNFEGKKAEAALRLGRHEFSKALTLAKSLNKRSGDDVLVYGLIADANIALGNYQDAEVAAQWMLDLRANNPQSLLHGAILRELFGDPDGAIELMTSAYLKTPPNDMEERAWILTRAAEMQIRMGKAAAAESQVMNALSQFRDYPYAIKTLAQLRMAQGKYAEAAALWRKLPASPEQSHGLARALERDGQSKAADAAYADFERKARESIDQPRNSNRELILYYADRGNKPAEALRIARIEIARRQDVCTLDAFAWALYANGDFREARKQIEKALGVGTRDAGFFNHASRIAAKWNDGAAAEKYAKLARQLNPAPSATP